MEQRKLPVVIGNKQLLCKVDLQSYNLIIWLRKKDSFEHWSKLPASIQATVLSFLAPKDLEKVSWALIAINVKIACLNKKHREFCADYDKVLWESHYHVICQAEISTNFRRNFFQQLKKIKKEKCTLLGVKLLNSSKTAGYDCEGNSRD
jgi:hypothetical protein